MTDTPASTTPTLILPGQLAAGLKLSRNTPTVSTMLALRDLLDTAGLRPGDLGVDDSFSYPNSDGLRAAGVGLQVRYASEVVGQNPKNWTQAQCVDCDARGIARLMVHEQTATDHLGGEPAGRAKADVFMQCAEIIGYPRDVPALVACDTSPTASMVDYAGGFERQVRDVHGWQAAGAYVFGPDGVQMLWAAQVCVDVLWQSYAGSAITGNGPANDAALEDAYRRAASRWGDQVVVRRAPGTNRTVEAVHVMAHAFQRLGRVAISTATVPESIDENEIRRPITAWLVGNVAPPVPPVQPVPPAHQGDSLMEPRFLHSSGAQYLLGPNGDDKVHVSPAYADLATAAGGVLIDANTVPGIDAKLDALGDGGSPRDVGGVVVQQVVAAIHAIPVPIFPPAPAPVPPAPAIVDYQLIQRAVAAGVGAAMGNFTVQKTVTEDVRLVVNPAPAAPASPSTP